MDYKKTINKSIGIGLILLILIVIPLWFILPNPESDLPNDPLKWLFIYSIPMFVGVLMIVLKRYDSEDLIKGCFSTNTGIEVERAYLQNTIEQTLIALPIVISFSIMSPINLLKAVPVHAITFLIGRLIFLVGYKKSYKWRIPGFIITNYANLLLFLGCLYLLILA